MRTENKAWGHQIEMVSLVNVHEVVTRLPCYSGSQRGTQLNLVLGKSEPANWFFFLPQTHFSVYETMVQYL